MQNPLSSIQRFEPRLRTLGIVLAEKAEKEGHKVVISSTEFDPNRKKLAGSLKVNVYDKSNKLKRSDKQVEELIATTLAEMAEQKRDWYTQKGLTVSLGKQKETKKSEKKESKEDK